MSTPSDRPADPPAEPAPTASEPTAADEPGVQPDKAAVPDDGPAPADESADTSAEPDDGAEGTPTDDDTSSDVTSERRWRRKRGGHRRKAPWWELPVLVLLAIGIAILVKSFVVQPFYIPSDSMEKTLAGSPERGYDRILVNKPIYSVLRDPEPGDIVVFDAPNGWERDATKPESGNVVTNVVRGFGQLVGFVPPDGQVLVKRVIATGGQTVKGDEQGHVMISTKGKDGPYRTLNEPYVYAPRGDGTQTAFGPVTVPKGRLWVMGDHRTDSADSRYHCTPDVEGVQNDDNCDPVSSTVPVDNVIGKAFVVAWPPSHWDILGTPNTFANAAAAVGPGLPATAGVTVAVPVLLVRRRRRRAAGRHSSA